MRRASGIGLSLLLLVLLHASLWGEAGSARLVPIDVPSKQELTAVTLLEAQKISVIAWSNALVDVSNFDSPTLRPLSDLSTTLTEADPRWDPWLKSQKGIFLPAAGISRLWVEPSKHDAALRALGNQVKGRAAADGPRGAVTARQVTGWMAMLAAMFYAALRLFTEGKSGFPGLGQWRSWIWTGPVLGLLLAGLLLIGIGGAFSGGGAPQSHGPAASWSRHLWYQTAWPYGATWDDQAKSLEWTYPAFERKDGRLTEIRKALPSLDQLGSSERFRTLDEHHAARVFGPENP